MSRAGPPTLASRAILLAAGAAAFATTYWPAPQLRRWVRAVAGHPRRAGPWLAVEHILVQTTLMAAACALVWALAARRGWMPPIGASFRLGDRRRFAGWTSLATVAILIIAGAGLLALGTPLAPHIPHGWDVLGNLFSNFYEDLIFFGFVFGVLRAVTGSAAVGVAGAAVLFGLVHTQYPVAFRALIAVNAAIGGAARVKTDTVWSAWTVHTISDIVLDALFF